MKEKVVKNHKTERDNLKEYESEFHLSQNNSKNQKYNPEHKKNSDTQLHKIMPHEQNDGQQYNSIPQNNNNFCNNNFNVPKIKINSMQDSFLNNCRHDRTIVEVGLSDHTTEKGYIVGFDMNTIIMENDDKYQYLIMKSAITKIKPIKSVNYIFNSNYKTSNLLFDYSGIKHVGG